MSSCQLSALSSQLLAHAARFAGLSLLAQQAFGLASVPSWRLHHRRHDWFEGPHHFLAQIGLVENAFRLTAQVLAKFSDNQAETTATRSVSSSPD